jgi:putative AdoMet-dependent methyltransferase
MLEQARRRLPEAHLYQVDLLSDEWPSGIKTRFDRIVSGYVFHEFMDDDKIALIQRLLCDHLASEGLMLIADISFSHLDRCRFAHESYGKLWDEEEFYWCAEVMIRQLEELGLDVQYVQKSPCAGVYVLQRTQDLNEGT